MKSALPGCEWLEVELLDPPLSVPAGKRLGAGEGEAIEFARRRPGLSVLLDDREGREAARRLGIGTIGTLSTVALAKQRGHIDSFDDAVKKIRDAGLFVSEKLINEVRQKLT